jgi:serine/threonine-protein kinase RsbT
MVRLSVESLTIEGEGDIVAVRKVVRGVATAMGFGITDITRIVTAASELARNIVTYAGSGDMVIRPLLRGDTSGIEMIFEDDGPGIADVNLALTVGYTTSGGLGLGLPGSRRLMDEMEIGSGSDGSGTKVTVRKWLRR